MRMLLPAFIRFRKKVDGELFEKVGSTNLIG